MPLDPTNDETQGVGKIELNSQNKSVQMLLRLQPLLDRIAARPATRLEADKEFYDSLYE